MICKQVCPEVEDVGNLCFKGLSWWTLFSLIFLKWRYTLHLLLHYRLSCELVLVSYKFKWDPYKTNIIWNANLLQETVMRSAELYRDIKADWRFLFLINYRSSLSNLVLSVSSLLHNFPTSWSPYIMSDLTF